MQPTDLVIDPATGQPALDTNGNTYTYNQAWYYTNLSGWVLREGIDELKTQIGALRAALTALANDQDITADALTTIVDRAVAEHTPTAEQVAAAQLPQVAALVRQALGDGNPAQDDVVDQVAAKLGMLRSAAGPNGR